MEQCIDVEFELNEDFDVDEDLDLKFNSFEDVEINIDEFIENDVETISEIPELRFVSDSGISKVTTWQGTPHVTEVENKCLRCGKNYMRRRFFDKHLAQYLGNKRK